LSETNSKDKTGYPRFSASNIAVNKQSQMFKNFYEKAGIDIEEREIRIILVVSPAVLRSIMKDSPTRPLFRVVAIVVMLFI